MIDRSVRRLCLSVAALLVGGAVLAGCDENEQDRALQFEKGSYSGRPDTPLSEEQREELRERTHIQSF